MRLLAAALARSAAFSARRPRAVLAVWAVASLVSLGLAGMRIEFRTSNLDLIDHELPPVKRFLSFANAFGTPNVLAVVLEGDDPSALEDVVRRAGSAIRALPGVRTVMDRLPLEPDLLKDLGMEEFLRTRDHGMYMLFVQPEDPSSSVEKLDPFVSAVRAAVAGVNPGARGVKAGYTGIPQYALDDRDVIQRDTSRLTFLSFGLIFLLFWTCFGRFRRPMATMGALLFGVALTAGVVAFIPGHLTLLSASFASALFGLGVEYGIHIINRIEERIAHGETEAVALPIAVEEVSRDITTGALTSAGVFASLCFSGFKGFAELGLISAIGILICLVSMCTVLPALLSLGAGGKRAAAPESSTNRIGAFLLHFQHPVMAWLMVAGACALILRGPPGFDSDYLDLQPADSETVRLEREMERRSNLSTQFAVFTVPSAREATRIGNRLLTMPKLVADVRSAAELEAAAPGENLFAKLPAAFQRSLIDAQGRHAVYAYPEGDIWSPPVQRAFVAAMQELDPEVTGMPVLGNFLVGLSRHALYVSLMVGLPLLALLVYLDFRHALLSLLALLPSLLAFPALLGCMTLLDFPFNPLNMMALPVILGIAVDDGVHLVHRFLAEKGDLSRLLPGAGRSIYLTSATTVAAFGSLAFTAHRGLASFAILMSLGVVLAFLLSAFLLPLLMRQCRNRGWLPHDASSPAAH